MQALIFRNPGIIDMRAVQVMGLHAKEHENPIGYFGTGLKYAIATLLRTGHKLTIYAGPKVYYFSVEADTFRDQPVQFIKMNDERLPFTLTLGKNWEVWMAFRELYSNMLDEKGTCEEVQLAPGDLLAWDHNTTMIVVEGNKIIQAFHEKDSIFLPHDKPLVKYRGVEIYSGPSKYVYYRGVRAGEWPRAGCCATFNFTNETILTEDRTIKQPDVFRHQIEEAVVLLRDRDTLTRFLIPNELNTEHDWNYSGLQFGNDECSSEFIELTGELRARSGFDINRGLYKFWLKKTKRAENEDLLRFEPSEVELAAVDTAKKFLIKAKLFQDKYPIIFVEKLGEGILAVAEDGKIWLSRAVIGNGTKILAHALLEEYCHLEHQYQDMTRGFQTFLFKTIISLAEEHVWRKPL